MTINEHNYESYLLDYVDGELSEAEQKLLLQYMAAHPELEEELKLLKKTKPQEIETLTFPKKELLYRTENKHKKAMIIQWKIIVTIAAAACIFLIFWFSHNENKPSIVTKKIAKTINSQSGAPSQTVASSIPKQTTKETKEGKLPKVEKQPLPATQQTKKTKPEEVITTYAISKIKMQPILPSVPQPSVIPTKQTAELKQYKNLNFLKHPKTISTKQQMASNAEARTTIFGTLDKLSNDKKNLDHSFTQKLFSLQKKISHPIKLLNIKKIKIGNVAFVFN